MTDTLTPEPAPPPPPSAPPPASAVSDERQMALIIYILYLVSCTGALGFAGIVGLVLAYVNRDTAPDWLKSHYTYQIRTFWIGLLYFLVAGVLCVVLIGIPLLFAAMVWFIVRCALGLSRLLRNEPYPTPESWTI